MPITSVVNGAKESLNSSKTFQSVSDLWRCGKEAPVAKVQTQSLSLKHGESYSDDYYWIRDESKSNPEIKSYLEQENEYSQFVIENSTINQWKNEISEEVAKRSKLAKVTYRPWENGNYIYRYGHDDEDSECIYRRHRLKEEEQLVLDSRLVKGDIGFHEISPCEGYIAFGTDEGGSETYTLHVRRIRDQKNMLPKLDTEPVIVSSNERITQSVRWFDCHSLIFVTGSEARSCKRISFPVGGEETTLDPVIETIYEESNPSFALNIDHTTDRKYLILTSQATICNETMFLERTDINNDDDSQNNEQQPKLKFTSVAGRDENDGFCTNLDHHQGFFYILVFNNHDAVNGKLIQVPEAQILNKDAWRVILDPGKHSYHIISFACLENNLVITEMECCQKRVRMVPIPGKEVERQHWTVSDSFYYLDFDASPEPIYTFFMTDKPNYESRSLIFMYMSYVTPRKLLEYHITTKKWDVIDPGTLANYDPSCYQMERIYAPMTNGDKEDTIPITMVYRKDLRKPNEPAPLVLFGYGAYWTAQQTWFTPVTSSLLDRGFIYATAHVRGGTEKGRAWAMAGQRRHKINSFVDFIACAEHLIQQGYTEPSKLTAFGRSAGGTLVAGSVLMRPELFQAVVLDVPFSDVITSLSDSSVPWSDYDRNEFGDPNDSEDYKVMKNFCPMRLLYTLSNNSESSVSLPHVFIGAAYNDSRVPYWEPVKLAAKWRALNQRPGAITLLRVDFDGGHYSLWTSASGGFDLRFAFLAWAVEH